MFEALATLKILFNFANYANNFAEKKSKTIQYSGIFYILNDCFYTSSYAYTAVTVHMYPHEPLFNIFAIK